MRPSDILTEEHRVIEVALDCLEKIAEQCGASGEVESGSAEEAIDFFAISPTDSTMPRKKHISFRPWKRRAFRATMALPV